MKMAKASQQDLDAAMELYQFLHAMADGRRAAIVVADFCYDGYDDLVRNDAPDVDYLLRAEERGSLFRVAFGMKVLLDPANEMVDPVLEHLEHHPRRLQEAEIAEDAEEAVREAERWRPMSTDLHGTVRDMVNELHRLSAEVEQQRTRAEAAEAELRALTDADRTTAGDPRA